MTENNNEFKDESYKFLREYMQKKLDQLQMACLALFFFGGYLILSKIFDFVYRLMRLTPEIIGLCIVIAGVVFFVEAGEAEARVKELMKQFDNEELSRSMEKSS